MIRVLRTRVRPDKVNEYMALMKSAVLPADEVRSSANAVTRFYRCDTAGPIRSLFPSQAWTSWMVNDLDGGASAFKKRWA